MIRPWVASAQKQAMLAQQPEVARSAYGRTRGIYRRDLIGLVRGLTNLKAIDQEVDLRGLEAADGDIEVEFGQVLELQRQ